MSSIPNPESRRYCALPTAITCLGTHHALLSRLGDGFRQLVPYSTALALSSCTRCRTLNEHVAEAAVMLKQQANCFTHSTIDYAATIRELVETGFLVPESELSSHFTESSTNRTSSHSSIRNIAISTCNRPESLRSLLFSLAESIHDRLDSIVLTIYDDSSEAATGHTREMIAETKQDLRCTVRYCDRFSRLRYAALISKATGVNQSVVDFALFGCQSLSMPSIGANRNAALLDLVGERFLFLDDDAIARVFTGPGHSSGVTLRSDRYPVRTAIHSDVDSAESASESHAGNILALHEPYLGHSLQELVFAGVSEFSTPLCSPTLWQSAFDGAGRVSSTQMGFVGDSGNSSPHWILSVEEPERSSIIDSVSLYRIARTSRFVTRLAPNMTITDNPFCMTTALGLDNTDELPPFFPTGRNSDGIFGVMLRLTDSDRCLGHLPFGILHRNPDHRPFSHDAVWQDAARLRISEVIIMLLRRFSTSVGCSCQKPNYASLAQYLIEISRLSDGDMENQLRQNALAAYQKRLHLLESLLSRYHAEPSLWAADVQKSITRILRAACDRRCGLPQDVPGRNSSDILRGTRDLLLGYGLLLQSWPTLRKVAREIHEEESVTIASWGN